MKTEDAFKKFKITFVARINGKEKRRKIFCDTEEELEAYKKKFNERYKNVGTRYYFVEEFDEGYQKYIRR